MARPQSLRFAGQACVILCLLMVPLAGSRVASAAATCHPAWSVFARSARIPPLAAVDARADDDVWAVGGASGGIRSPIRSQAAIVHWDGRTLSTTHFPWRDAELEDVAVAAADDVWSVGSIGKHALALHWDGRHWRRTPVWPWAHAWLSSVAAVSPTDVWAAGGFRKRPLIAHWDGQAWHVNLLWRVAPNFADFRAIAAPSRNSIWASGEEGLDAPTTFGFGDLEVHWDGRRWHRIAQITHTNYDNVADATAVAPDGELWELSSDYSGNGVDVTRWASQTESELSNVLWEPDSLPDLFAVAPLSRASAWAVGTGDSDKETFRPIVARWNGHAWHTIHTPFDHVSGELTDIVSISPDDLWAVGSNLIVHYSC